MDTKELTLNDLYPLETVMEIFNVNHPAAIRGGESFRLANRWNWVRVPVGVQKTGYLRNQIKATCILLDMKSADLLEPEVTSELIWHYTDKNRLVQLVEQVADDCADLYTRCLLADSRQPEYPDIAIKHYMTVTDVMAELGLSRQFIYTITDKSEQVEDENRLRVPLRTVSYQRALLWLPGPVLRYKKEREEQEAAEEAAKQAAITLSN